MRHASTRVLAVLLTFLRSLWWSMVEGLTMLGATFYGGAAVGASWMHTGAVPTATPDDTDDTQEDIDVTGEAERGIAQIEVFLAARSTDRPGR